MLTLLICFSFTVASTAILVHPLGNLNVYSELGSCTHETMYSRPFVVRCFEAVHIVCCYSTSEHSIIHDVNPIFY